MHEVFHAGGGHQKLPKTAYTLTPLVPGRYGGQLKMGLSFIPGKIKEKSQPGKMIPGNTMKTIAGAAVKVMGAVSGVPGADIVGDLVLGGGGGLGMAMAMPDVAGLCGGGGGDFAASLSSFGQMGGASAGGDAAYQQIMQSYAAGGDASIYQQIMQSYAGGGDFLSLLQNNTAGGAQFPGTTYAESIRQQQQERMQHLMQLPFLQQPSTPSSYFGAPSSFPNAYDNLLARSQNAAHQQMQAYQDLMKAAQAGPYQ